MPLSSLCSAVSSGTRVSLSSAACLARSFSTITLEREEKYRAASSRVVSPSACADPPTSLIFSIDCWSSCPGIPAAPIIPDGKATRSQCSFVMSSPSSAISSRAWLISSKRKTRADMAGCRDSCVCAAWSSRLMDLVCFHEVVEDFLGHRIDLRVFNVFTALASRCVGGQLRPRGLFCRVFLSESRIHNTFGYFSHQSLLRSVRRRFGQQRLARTEIRFIRFAREQRNFSFIIGIMYTSESTGTTSFFTIAVMLDTDNLPPDDSGFGPEATSHLLRTLCSVSLFDPRSAS
ncbi:hypothetical protein EYF80_050213 [Liparis tanakae]|uniref:Uncharacterized protein n=1 Tax=Liparis tanakae TaxID=230148 RepID=A0A4Z2FFU3_9TELE|nr:hypothetical protein EYF80_050213 [Liparis tanakae]